MFSRLNSLISTSEDRKVAEEFATQDRKGGTLLKIYIPPYKQCKLCSINAISEHASEKEWLVGPSVFKVEKETKKKQMTVMKVRFWRSVFYSWVGELAVKWVFPVLHKNRDKH